MALRTIRILGDPVLEKKCRPVDRMTLRLKMLVGDMFETMYDANGVGLAAPQVGVLRRIVVIDVGKEDENGELVPDPHVLVNPEIIETDGEQCGDEGCLSFPGKFGVVTRPQKVKVRAFDINMNPYELEGEDLLARAICHECDHLEGVMYTTKVEGEIHDASEAEEEE